MKRGRGRSLLVVLAGLSSLGMGVEVDLPATPRIEVHDPAVRKAMQDELTRSMSDLRLGDEPRPYYLAYTVSDVVQAQASATFGAVTGAVRHAARVLRTDLRVGDPSFDNTNFEGSGGRFASLPLEDDYAALRRELWLRTDEAYKGALETLARKRAAAASQVTGDDEDDAVADFSKQAPARIELPFTAAEPEAQQLRDLVVKLSAIFRDYPHIIGSRVTGTAAVVRRRMTSSEGTFVDDHQNTVRIDVTAEVQADDGMKLRSFVPFATTTLASLPPAADMEKAVRAMATELTAMRVAPIAVSGSGPVLFEGLAAAQLVKRLLADNLSGTPPPRTAAAGSEERSEQSELANKIGQKVAAPLLSVVDDPLQELGPGKRPLFGAYKADDEGVPAQRVSLIERGLLKALLMSRTPRKELTRSNGHARASRFTSPRAYVGNLFVSGQGGRSRPALLGQLGKLATGGGVTPYVVRLLEDPNLSGGSDGDDFTSMLSFGMGGSHGPPPVRPLVVYRVVGGKETLVRGLTLENLLPRSLKDIVAIGKDPFVYNTVEGGSAWSGIPSSIVTPSLLFGDIDIRRQTGRHRKPPLYPHPGFLSGAH